MERGWKIYNFLLDDIKEKTISYWKGLNDNNLTKGRQSWLSKKVLDNWRKKNSEVDFKIELLEFVI